MAIIKRTADDYIFDGITKTLNANNGFCIEAGETCICSKFIKKVKNNEYGEYCDCQRFYIAELPNWYNINENNEGERNEE